MPRRKRSSSISCGDLFDEDFDDDSSESGQMPVQRNAANARERARMRVLSSAFCRLKTKLPWVPPDTKLSKLDTLRLAKGYIQQLEAILAGEPIEDNLHMATNQHNLSWPFIFQSNCCDSTTHKATTNNNGQTEVLTRNHHTTLSEKHNTPFISQFEISQNQLYHTATLS